MNLVNPGVECIHELKHTARAHSLRFRSAARQGGERRIRIGRRAVHALRQGVVSLGGGGLHLGVRELEATGTCAGTIATAPRGEAGFGYDPVFVPEGEGRTMAEMSGEVSDEGVVDNPLAGRHQPEQEAPQGRGLWMVNQLCDLVQLRSGPQGTQVRIHTWL